MRPTKDDIKAWLKNTQRSREWLASQFGDTKKKTVDNWLSSNQDIPIGILTAIGRMMEDDRRLADAEAKSSSIGHGDQQIFSVQVNLETFRSYNRAAVARGLTLEEWIIKTCDDEVTRLANPAERNIVPITAAPAARVAEATYEPAARGGRGAGKSRVKTYWLDLVGGVAAGSPISSDLVIEPIPVGKEYPEDHYALVVSGRSMEPKISDRATIVVRKWDRARTPKKGSIVVYHDGHGATLKEFGYRAATAKDDPEIVNTMGKVAVLRSLNPAFPQVQTMEGGRIDAEFVEVV